MDGQHMGGSQYKTLKAYGSDSFLIKKSKFIGHGCPAQTEQEALDFLRSIQEKYRDASHNCYAYVIGRNAGIMRYSDDGEPSGTAGMPIIEVIRARGVTNCCVVVTRYFGGVLLGAGGLTRAYAQGAGAALAAAQVVVMAHSVRFWVGMEYSLWGLIEYYLRDAPVVKESVDFGATVTATLVTRVRDVEAVYAQMTNLTEGRAELLELERFYHGFYE